MTVILIAYTTRNKETQQNNDGGPPPYQDNDNPDVTQHPIGRPRPLARPTIHLPTYPKDWRASHNQLDVIRFSRDTDLPTPRDWPYTDTTWKAMLKYVNNLEWPSAEQPNELRGEVSWVELAIDFELYTQHYLPYLPTIQKGTARKGAQNTYLNAGTQEKPHSTTTPLQRGLTFSNIFKAFEKQTGNAHEGESTDTRTLQTIGHRRLRGLTARPTFNAYNTDQVIMALTDLHKTPKFKLDIQAKEHGKEEINDTPNPTNKRGAPDAETPNPVNKRQNQTVTINSNETTNTVGKLLYHGTKRLRGKQALPQLPMFKPIITHQKIVRLNRKTQILTPSTQTDQEQTNTIQGKNQTPLNQPPHGSTWASLIP